MDEVELAHPYQNKEKAKNKSREIQPSSHQPPTTVGIDKSKASIVSSNDDKRHHEKETALRY